MRSRTRWRCSPTRSRCRCTASPDTHRRPAAEPSCGAPGPSVRARWRSCGPSTPMSRWRWSPASARRPTSPARSARTTSSGSGQPRRCSRTWRPGPEGVLRPTMEGLDGLAMCHPGGIDVAYDTVGKPETFTIEVREGPGHAREERCARARPLGVESLVLQGDQLGRLQRVRHRGGRRGAQARHRALPRSGRRRTHRPQRPAHPCVPAVGLARRASARSPISRPAARSRSPSIPAADRRTYSRIWAPPSAFWRSSQT